MLAGLGQAWARQLHFFIAEEGITAAAYVVVTVVAERRRTIRAWLPRGFVAPQVTIVSTKPSTNVLMVRSLGSTAVQPRLFGDDVLYWRGDIF